MELPESNGVDVGRLSAIFNDTTNSYKFYWFLCILDLAKNDEQAKVSYNDLAMQMFVKVWYPLDYYKLSFGKQDSFKSIGDFISSNIEVDNSRNSRPIFDQLKMKLSKRELTEIETLVKQKVVRYVPYRFLTPFLDGLAGKEPTDSKIRDITNHYFDVLPDRIIYRIVDESIELNDVWMKYIRKHHRILEGFTYWHLIQFLQKHNSNVVGLSDKLFKQPVRKLKLAELYWTDYLKENPDLRCIYSNQVITEDNISMDHFLPWSYVVHDLLWNIIPTPKNVNSSKNNSLPSKGEHFDRYANLQFEAFQFHARRGNNALLEAHSILFKGDIPTIKALDFIEFKHHLSQTILPQLQMAENLGFKYPFVCPDYLKQ